MLEATGEREQVRLSEDLGFGGIDQIYRVEERKPVKHIQEPEAKRVTLKLDRCGFVFCPTA